MYEWTHIRDISRKFISKSFHSFAILQFDPRAVYFFAIFGKHGLMETILSLMGSFHGLGEQVSLTL